MQERALKLTAASLAIALMAAGPARALQQREAPPPERAKFAVAKRTAPEPRLDDSIVTGTALLEEFFGESLDQLGRRKPAPRYDLDFLIVSLPDPLDSFLDWAFDADLESMRRAFESAQFVTDRFWLPWDKDRTVVSGTSATHYRWNHPGVFLFRNSNTAKLRLRLVYVVGEISTGGVHKQALEAALAERDTLHRKPLFADATGARDTIRFVGPYFTGAALSTRLTVERWRRANRDSTFALFVSGSATGTGNMFVFDSSADAVTPASRMSFHATVNSDLTLSLAMLRVMVDTTGGLGIPPDHIALVQESSTQYGQQAAARLPPLDSPESITWGESQLSKPLDRWKDTITKATGAMLVIPYPMSISSLRSEYAKYPPVAKADNEFKRDPEPRIPLPLYDSNQQLESPIPVARMTPASLELMIDEITQTLKSHDIRAIGLIGTDVRDKIFLADRLRKQLPDVRLFTFGSSDLYLREEYNNSLRGLLVFSTYPLFLENQWWDSVTRVRPRRFAFASDDAQGVFNATLRQLGRRGLREYRPPFASTDEYPPVWVTAVGRHSFIPIRTLRKLGGSGEYLEKVTPRVPDTTVIREDHVSPSDWVSLFAYIGSAALIVILVLRDDANSRTLVPVHEPPSSRITTSTGNNSVPMPQGSTAEMAIRRFVDRRRLGLRAALLLHREVFTFLRHLALLCLFATLAVILVPPPTEYEQLGWASPAVYSVLRLAALSAFVVFGLRVRDVWLEWGGAYCDYVYRPSHKWIERELARLKRVLSRIEKHQLLKTLSMLTPTVEYEIRALAPRSERSAWRREGVVIAIIAIVGIVYAAAVARLMVDLNSLSVADGTLFLHRAMQLDSGVSPIFPIALSSAALTILCTWQLSRLRLLDEVTAFEEAFQLSSTKVAQTDVDEIKSRIAKGLHAARMQLSRVLPGLPGGIVKPLSVLLFLILAWALWMHFEPSFEAITGLRRIGNSTAFDIVFRLSIIVIFIAAAWGLARLVMVWRALRLTLNALDASPLITAFERLPRRIARLTRLTLFADPSRETVLGVTATQWTHLRRLFESNELAFNEVSVTATADVRLLMADEAPLHGRDHRRAGFTFAPQLRQMLDIIERFWAAEPASAQIDAVLGDLKRQAQTDGASTSGRIRRSAPDAVRLWVRSAEEFVAVQAVDYIAWIIRHLRRLVLMLLFLLVVTMGLLSSYSFLPQSVVRSLFLALFIAVVAALLLLLSQMNRNEVLSRITRTDPGRVNWSSGFLFNIGTVVAIPILSLVSAFSPLRTDLFGWVDAFLRLMSKH